MTENIISWNVANWITVILMALMGYAVLTVIAKVATKKSGSADD